MGVWKRKKKQPQTTLWQAEREQRNPFSLLDGYTPLLPPEYRLYETLREGVPLIDAALQKIVRLVGGFSLTHPDKSAQRALDHFAQTVSVGGVGMGLEQFTASFLDSLLTFGNAAGEMILSPDGKVFLGLYNADIAGIRVKAGDHPLHYDFYVPDGSGKLCKLQNHACLLFGALNPKPGECTGVSLLRSLPFVTNILLKIYRSIGLNFDRIGNVRYAVTYKPSGDGFDRTLAKERAALIAREWSEGMRATKDGQVKDFITVGDVSIKVIGADNQMIETEVPVRQMMEQIVAKLSLPPFLLGLSWSTTERMSKQQSDLLTTELEYYRRLLTPLLQKIGNTYLSIQGYDPRVAVSWKTINLKDEVEEAQARYYHAQAAVLEQQLASAKKE